MSAYPLNGTGRVIYDPRRPGMKRRTEGWCVANIDDELARYYRWWVMKRYWIELCKPSWGAHISIVRGERVRPKFQHNWKLFQNKKINFKYTNHVLRTGKNGVEGESDHFWYVNVISDDLNDIRNSLGLRIYPHYHITIGRTYE